MRAWMAVFGLMAAATPAVAQDQATKTPQSEAQFPRWAPIIGRRPVREEMLKVYPRAALAARQDGRVLMRCGVSKLSNLLTCAVVEETPAGQGFGAAALKLVDKFNIVPPRVNGRTVRGGEVLIPLVWTSDLARDPEESPAPLGPGEVGLRWRSVPGQMAVNQTYPPNAYRQSIPGEVTARCRALASGRLSCEVIEERPVNYGFGKNAHLILNDYVLEPTASDGKSVEGIEFTLMVRWSMQGIFYTKPLSATRP